MSSASIVIVSFLPSTENRMDDFGILCFISGESDWAITEASFGDEKKKRNVAFFIRF